MQSAIERQSPPKSGLIRPKLRYAHQGGMNPPVIVIHGNSLEHVTDAYKRFLEGRFRAHFKLTGTPLRIEMRSSTARRFPGRARPRERSAPASTPGPRAPTPSSTA